MDDTPFQRLGYNVLLVFLFLAFSRIFDVKFGYLHITGMAYRIVFLMVLLSGAIPIPLKSNIGKALLGFTFCIGLSVPFSVWRWGSKGISDLADIFLRSVSGRGGSGEQLSTVFQGSQDARLGVFGFHDHRQCLRDLGEWPAFPGARQICQSQ